MKLTSVHMLGAKDVPYKINGTPLVDLRRAELRKVASKIGVESNGTKNEILGLVNAKLKAIGAQDEILDT